MHAVILSVVMFLSVSAFSQDVTEAMRQVQKSYNQRFDSAGKYLDNPTQRDQFTAFQNTVIHRLKTAGNVQKFFHINNNVMAGMVFTVSLVLEKSGKFAGLLVERSSYATKNDEALLRLYGIPILLGGMDAFSFNGKSLVTLKSQSLNADQGGVVSIKYPTNFTSHTFDQADFSVTKNSAGSFSFFTPAKRSFSQVKLDIWVNLLAGNFGVKSVLFAD